MRIGAAIGAAVMAYHMGVPHRQTAPVSAGAIGWDASIGLRTVIHGPSTNAPSGAAINCTVGKLYSKPRQLLQITGRQLRVWGWAQPEAAIDNWASMHVDIWGAPPSIPPP